MANVFAGRAEVSYRALVRRSVNSRQVSLRLSQDYRSSPHDSQEQQSGYCHNNVNVPQDWINRYNFT